MTLFRLSTVALALAVPLLACASAAVAAPVRHGSPAQVLIATYVQPMQTDIAYRHHHRSRRLHRHFGHRS